MKSSNLWWCSSASIAIGLLSTVSIASANEGPPRNTIAGAEELRLSLFAVSINGSLAGEPIALLVGNPGALYASEADLKALRLKLWEPALVHDGTRFYQLHGVPGLQVEITDATQSVRLTASPRLLQSTVLTAPANPLAPMTASASGGFLNYDVVAQMSSGRAALNGLFEFGLFAPWGIASSTFVARHDTRRTDMTRLETSWTSTDPDAMRFLRLGDSVSRGGLGGSPLRFIGVHLARDFSTQPGFVTMPLPTIRGQAEISSIVDLYVNNVLAGTRQVPPGPFSIDNVPVVTGGGDVTLVVRDLLGREVLLREPYYTSRQLLRSGLNEYSFEAGFLRRGFGRSSFDYGAAMVSGSYRHGISDGFTGEIHGEAAPDVQMAGLGAGVAIARLGVMNAAASFSHSERGVGARYALGFESRTPHLSYGVLAELIDDDFVTVGNSGSDRRPASLTLQAFAGIPLDFGSLSLSYIRRDDREGRDAEFFNLTSSISLGQWGAISIIARKSLKGPAGDAVLVSYTVPIGARTSASMGGELGQTDLARLSLQKSVPAGEGFGFRAAAQIGDLDRFDGRLTYQTDFGRYDVDVSWVGSAMGMRVSASGGVGHIGDATFASRRLTQSFAAVKVGNYAGVRVYADNQHVGQTDDTGTAIIPRLRPFESNMVRIEVADLPIDTLIETSEQIARPFDRSGVALDFGVRPARGAIVTLVQHNGQPVPAGALVRLEGANGQFVVAPGGEAYLTGLGVATNGVASWAGGSCAFAVDFPERLEMQPRLGPIACTQPGP